MPTAYDTVHYPSQARKESHPSRLQTLALLAGLKPAPLARCRVLELGCGTGANLIPFAQDYPEAECLGVDLAESALELARADASALGCSNLHYQAGDLAAWSAPGRQFDYIIVHGVFSWVPEPVRQGILDICRRHLAEHGVAFISYNAYPGCHLRRIVWDMLKFHTSGHTDPAEKVRAAIAFAKAVIDVTPDEKIGSTLRDELMLILDKDPSVVFHDDLAEINQPFYLHEFIALAAGHSLQYLSDADYARERGIPPQFVTRDRAQERQYSDMFFMRRFRETLLCRSELALDPVIRWNAVQSMLAGCPAQAEAAQPDGSRKFVITREFNATVGDPQVCSQLLQLSAAWPAMLPVREVGFEEASLDRLLRLWIVGLVELRAEPPQVASRLSARPIASPLARLQLKKGAQSVTSQRHIDLVLADEITRALVAALDGTSTVPELANQLFAKLQTGELPLPEQLREQPSSAPLRDSFDDLLNISMQMLLRMNLLVA